MKLDLAFVLIDLGESWYKTAASEMIRSARRAYKDHDMRVVQLTDAKTAHHPDADGVFSLGTDVAKEQMCQAKGHLIAEYALKADRPVIFCDVDLIWNNAGALQELAGGEHVSCLWRDDMPSMPINTGIVGTFGEKGFWEVYRAACENLPSEVCGWWGDQFAMSAAWLDYFAARPNLEWGCPLRKMDMDQVAPAIDTLPDKPLDTPAVHFKGPRKHLMVPYARMLDQGRGFDYARPSDMNSAARQIMASPEAKAEVALGRAIAGIERAQVALEEIKERWNF